MKGVGKGMVLEFEGSWSPEERKRAGDLVRQIVSAGVSGGLLSSKPGRTGPKNR